MSKVKSKQHFMNIKQFNGDFEVSVIDEDTVHLMFSADETAGKRRDFVITLSAQQYINTLAHMSQFIQPKEQLEEGANENKSSEN